MDPREALRDELSYRRDEIADSALRCFLRSDVESVSIGEIIKECGASRSSVYREFPSGKAGVLRYLHIQTVLIVDGAIARRVTSPFLRNYRSVVQEGARGLFDGLSWAPWTGQYLVRHPGFATAYVLNPEDGGLIRSVADYTAACAARLGAKETEGPSRALVRDLLTFACRDLAESAQPSWPAEFPGWPKWIDTPVEEFLRATGLQNKVLESGDGGAALTSSSGSIAGLLAATSAARL